jgi:hypothetical protein
MALKSAYREKAAEKIPPEPVENIPEIKVDGEPAPPPALEAPTPVEPDAAIEAAEVALEADAAKSALQRQVEALKRGEELQRQQAEAVARAQAFHALSPEEKVEAWKRNGLTDREGEWLKAHPEAIEFPALANFASAEALQAGHKRDSDQYFQHVEERFQHHMQQLKAQAAAQTPEFFKPPEPKRGATPDTGYFTSAPVSRQAPTAGPRIETNPRQMRLSAEEIAIARASGISEVEYARNKIELERQKRMGERQ